ARPISTMPSSVRGRRITIREALSGSRAPVPLREFPFPFKRCFYDLLEVVVPRLPAERGTNARRTSDQCGWIAGPTGFLPLLYGVSGDALDGGKQLPDAVAAAVATVQCRGFAAGAQVGERLQMSVGEVLDMNVIAHARTVRSGVIRAEY